MAESAITYSLRDNTFTVTLKLNNVALSEAVMTAITKYEIKYKGVYYNSVDNADGFVVDNTAATVVIKPYELVLPVGTDTKVEFIVYDAADYTHGIVWGTPFKLQIKKDAIPL